MTRRCRRNAAAGSRSSTRTCRGVIRQRRQASERPDDAMTALVDYRDENGRPLPDEKILLHLSKDVITGGIDTTTHLVGNLFYDLLSTPGAYERVRDDRDPRAARGGGVPAPSSGGQRALPPPGRRLRIPGGEDPRRLGRGARVFRGEPRRGAVRPPRAVRSRPGRRGTPASSASGGGRTCASVRHWRGSKGAHVLDAMLDRIPRMRLAPGFRYERVTTFMMRGPVRLDVELDA